MTTETRVIFRIWRKGGEVLALMPNEEWGPGQCASYEHVGQHGGADYRHCIRATRPALPHEYADLKTELESIGYRVRVAQRKGE